MIIRARCFLARRDAILDYYGELSQRRRDRLQRHAAACPVCSTQITQIQTALRAIPHRSGEKPDETHWAAFWQRIEHRLQDAPASAQGHHQPTVISLRPVHAGIAAVVLISIGVILGRMALTSDTPGSPSMSFTDVEVERIAASLDRASLILTEIANNSSAYASEGVVPSPTQREVSLQLARELEDVRDHLDPVREQELRELLWQMEVHLTQFAALDSRDLAPGISMISEHVRRDLLLWRVGLARRVLTGRTPSASL